MSDHVNNPNRKAPLERYRNIGISAHIDAGKTTLSERILFYTGMIHKIGETHDGSTTTDWMEQERERGITITSAAVTTNWKQVKNEGISKMFEGENFQLNIIDTPGHVDFTAEVERSLRVLDGAIVVFCGVAGVQPQTETVWRQATKYSVPRMCFVNKMDRTGANFNNVLDDIHNKLGANAAAILIPIGAEDQLRGQIDVVNQKAVMYADNDRLGSTYTVEEIPAELKEEAELAYHELVSRVADVDDELAEKVLMEEPFTPKELKEAIRRATITNKFIPVAGGSAFKNKGVQFLLDAVVDYLPLRWKPFPPTLKARWMRKKPSRLPLRTTPSPWFWHSSSGLTSSSASWCSSACTPASSRRVTPCTTPAPARRNAWAASSRSRLTSTRTLTPYTPATSPPSWACAT